MNEEIKIQELSLGNVSQDLPTTTNAQDQPSVYLVETFYITSKKNTVFQVRLTEKGLSLRKKSNGSSKEQTILLEDIIGCRCLRSKRKRNTTAACACSSLPGGESQLRVVEDNSVDLDETDVSAYLYIYAYILKKNRRGGLRERTTLTLRFRSFDKYDDNNKEAQKWRSAVKKLLTDRMSMSPNGYTMKDMRKVLILVNPKSGSGKARETFQQRVAPIFLEAEIPYELHVTKHANYARDYVRHKDIHIYKYIVVVGGDGLYFEVINGMFERADWERAISEISIGIIPCGSGNGLAKSIAHSYKSCSGSTATEHLYMDHVICAFGQKYASENSTCKLNFISRLKKSLTVSSYVIKPVTDIIGYCQLYYRFRAGYKLFLINLDINLCDYFNKKAPSKILDIVMPVVNKHLRRNRPVTCPESVGRLEFKNIPVNSELFKFVFLPTGHYMLNLTGTTKEGDLLWNGKFYFDVPDGKTIDADRMGR
ncbi:Sphingosine kinase 2 [Pseudolycoriella hygida]|uniref:sphingosine kinase n=1 Tax=Pseudolycoriella hygida TaxID=35572 RepID=A0A9Q0MLA4_9DIPT|nr:Sphingosine kinase 2 [Pseudolycoriella hygida]